MESQIMLEKQQWSIALDKLQSAIGILDRSNAPIHIAAHIDLAAHQLQEAIRCSSESAQVG